MKLTGLLLSLASAAVIKLTDETFLEQTHIGSPEQEHVWFVKFFAPWCPHCKRMAPEWDLMSEQVADNIRVAEVNVVDETKLRDKFDITGFPRMYLYDTDGKMYKYPGRRDAAAFKAFAEGGFRDEEPVAITSA